jgi:hypothetical protein
MKHEPDVTGGNHEQKTATGQVYAIHLENHYPQKTGHNKVWFSCYAHLTLFLPGEGILGRSQ